MDSYQKMDSKAAAAAVADKKRGLSRAGVSDVPQIEMQRKADDAEVIRVMMKEIRELKETIRQLQIKQEITFIPGASRRESMNHLHSSTDESDHRIPLLRNCISLDSWKEWVVFIGVVAATTGGLVALAVLLSQQLSNRSIREDVFDVNYGDAYILFDIVICQNLNLRKNDQQGGVTMVPCQPPLVRRDRQALLEGGPLRQRRLQPSEKSTKDDQRDRSVFLHVGGLERSYGGTGKDALELIGAR